MARNPKARQKARRRRERPWRINLHTRRAPGLWRGKEKAATPRTDLLVVLDEAQLNAEFAAETEAGWDAVAEYSELYGVDSGAHYEYDAPAE